MATSTLTTGGAQFFASALNPPASELDLRVRVGTGRRRVEASVTSLAQEYQLNGATHALPLVGAGLTRDASNNVTGFTLEALDGATAAAYQATEIGVFDSSARLVAYVAADSGTEILVSKGQNSIVRFTVPFLITVNAGATITITTTVGGAVTATQARQGNVQLARDGDRTSTGAVVMSPAQVAAAIAAAPGTPFASSVEINNGTVVDKAIPPRELARSDYKRIIQRTQAQYDAITTKDANVLYAIVG